MFTKRAADFFVLLAFVAIHVNAQEARSWIGQKVVIKYKYPVKAENRVVDDGSRFRIYTVARVNGDSLWVASGSIEGWLPAGQVVPFDQAINFYSQEIRANPGNPAAWVRRGIIWFEKKEFDIATADLNEAIRLDPGNALTYNARGRARGYKKEYDKAIADFNEAIRLDPKDALAYQNRGAAWHFKNESAKAIADLNESIRLNPKLAAPYNYRALLWATCPDPRFRDGKKGVESATRACNLSEWKRPYYVCTLAAAYAESGDFDKAVETQQQAIDLLTDEEARKEGLELLRLLRERKPYRETE
jgi:tetratricopeptide (TPR) repeat protein